MTNPSDPVEEGRENSVRLFQINESDLADLERLLPVLLDASMLSCNNPGIRVKWRKVKEILSNVRWWYGPPSNVSIIPAEGQ